MGLWVPMKVAVDQSTGPLASQRLDPDGAARIVKLNRIARARDSPTENDMNEKMLDHKYKTGHARARTTTLLGGLILALSLPVTGLKAQVLDTSRSVLLSWPQSAQEQIVVGADSLASNAVWTPWPEPIFKRFGQMCVAVPTTASQQFFKTVLGTQFVDDFSDTAFTEGFVGLFVDMPDNNPESHEVTLDNFFVTGTKP